MKSYNDILSNPIVEAISSLIKGTLATLPYTGGIASIFNDWQNHVQFKAIQDTLSKHLNQLKTLETRIDHSFCTSKEYGAIILQTLAKAKDEIKEEKRTLFATFLTSCCIPINSSCNDKRMYLDIIDRLEPIHICIMDVLDNKYSTFGKIDNIQIDMADKGINDLSINHLETYLDYLTSLGLVVKIDQSIYKIFFEKIGLKDGITSSFTHTIYYKTPLGYELINFLIK